LIGFEDNAPFDEFLSVVGLPQGFVSGADLRLKMLNTLSTRRNEAAGLGLTDDINNWWLTIFNDLFPTNADLARGMWELFKCSYFDSLFPDTIPILQRLKARGVPMGIISNYNSDLLDLLLYFDIADYFDFAIVSSNEGVAKPDPRIFQLGLEAAGVEANQVLYIGDNVIDDIQGANNAGIDAVLINRPGRKPSTAPLMINSLLEIEKMLYPNKGTHSASKPYTFTDLPLPVSPLASVSI
jgi:HAD superfamily hydrolase (TIGR01549 family)